MNLRIRRDIDVAAADEDTSLGFTSDMMAMRGQVFEFEVLSSKVAQLLTKTVNAFPIDEGDAVLLYSRSKANPFIWRTDWLERIS